ncbi:MAG: flagellar hook-basal body complex protein FliE [Alteromonadaceae bacterium]|jgi:flagellar hook-basal body complex protein FliE
MNIKANALFSELQAVAQQAGGNIGGVSQQVRNTSQVDFSSTLKNAIDNVNTIAKASGTAKRAVDMGDRSVSMAEAMIASQKAGVAFEATVQVRNKMLEAYKDIMSMPV